MKKSLPLFIFILIIACKGDHEVNQASEIESDTIKKIILLAKIYLGKNG